MKVQGSLPVFHPGPPKAQAGLTRQEIVDSCFRGGGSYVAGLLYPTTYLHELGHAVAVNALYQGADPHITVTPLVGGVTRWTQGAPLTDLGQKLGRSTARTAVAAAGTAVDVGLSTIAFAAGYMLRKKQPWLGCAMMGYAGFGMAQTVLYALSAVGSTFVGNDFGTFAAMTGVPPLVTAGVLAAILPAEYLLLRYLERKGILDPSSTGLEP
ncbi:MAG: hypothetical protein AB1758_05560 [Candidatus Eremiobacterota bacterium]